MLSGVSRGCGVCRTGREAQAISTSNDKALHDASPRKDRCPVLSLGRLVFSGLFIETTFRRGCGFDHYAYSIEVLGIS